MNRRLFVCALVSVALGPSLLAEAQQPGKLPRIGFLGNSTASLEADLVGAFREGLRGLGYVEGRNVAIEYRWADGRYERLPALVAELIAARVDVIVTAGTPAALAVKKATSSVPLVMVAVGDPVGTGIVPSLSNPGGNITGVTSISTEMDGKRLELLREVTPGVAHVAVLWNSASPLQVLADRLFLHHRILLMEFATRQRLPGVHAYRELVEVGGLMSFGPNYDDMHRRAAYFVDRILKGAKPADLPVERPPTFELVVNLKAAAAIGVAVPAAVLLRATEVIQ